MSRTEKPDDDPWKTEVEKVARTSGKSSGSGRGPSAGRYVVANNAAPRERERDISSASRMKEGIRKVSTGNDGNRHVVPNRDRGGWDVVKENHERSSGHFETQKEAIDRARQIVEKTGRGNGEIVIHGKDGKIRDSDSGSRNETRARDRR